MNSFKQALNHFKADWQRSLLFGLVATFFVVLARMTPFLGSVVLSMVMLIFQDLCHRVLIDGQSPRGLSFSNKDFTAYVIVTLTLFPTGALFGSSLGLIESPQEPTLTIPLSLALMTLACYFYLILSQALRWHQESQLSLARSIDLWGMASVKNFKAYVLVSFYLGIFLCVSGITKGVGLVIALPFIFLVNHYLYLEQKLTVNVPAQP